MAECTSLKLQNWDYPFREYCLQILTRRGTENLSVKCFSNLRSNIDEHRVMIADEEVMNSTQLKFLLVNCQRHKLGQKLEQSTREISIQAIIILHPLEDHYAIAREYVERINIPLFFLEERCERIVELVDRFPDLKAKVLLTAGKDDSHLSFVPRQYESKGLTQQDISFQGGMDSTCYKLHNALHIITFKDKEEFTVSCFTKVTGGIGEQQLTLAGEKVADVAQLRFLVLNCQKDKLAQQLEQATKETTIQAIIILYPSEEHLTIAQEYVHRIKPPLLFVEERCEKIVELMDRFPDLKAKVVAIAKANRDESQQKEHHLIDAYERKDREGRRAQAISLEPFLQVSELLRKSESMRPRSMQENPSLFFKIIGIIRSAKDEDVERKPKKAKRIYEEGIYPFLKYPEAKADFLYYITFIREIFIQDVAKVSEYITPLLQDISSQQVLPKDLKAIFTSFFTTCNSPTAIHGCQSMPKNIMDLLKKEKGSFKQIKDVKELTEKLFWSNLQLLMEEVFHSHNAAPHFAVNYWNSFFTQKCKVAISEGAATTFSALSEGVAIGKSMGMNPERRIQPYHFILLLKKEKSLKTTCLAFERLISLSSYSEGHQFIIKFKEYFYQWDETKFDQLVKDPEYIINACRLMSFLSGVVHNAKELAPSEAIKSSEQLEIVWMNIYNRIIVLWATPFGTEFPLTYPDDLLDFKMLLNLPTAPGLNRRWTFSYINPTLKTIINRTNQYSPEVFYSIITKFSFLTNKEFIMGYLEGSTHKKDVSLRAKIWTQILDKAFTISTQYEDSKRVFESVLTCLHKIYKQYIFNQTARERTMTGVIEFIRDLLLIQLECKPNYYPDRINQTEPWKLFKASFTRLTTQIQNYLGSIIAALPDAGETTILQEWFMDMILDAATPVQNELMSPQPTLTTTQVFIASIGTIQEWFKRYEIQDLTPKYLYAWKVLASCCKNTTGIKHLQLHNMPQFISSLLELYSNTTLIANTYIEETCIQTVVEVFNNVREHLKAAAYDIRKNNITFTLLYEYLKNQDNICKLYRMSDLGKVFTKEELEKMDIQYNQIDDKLSKKLILQLPKKAFPHCPWKLLKDALEQFGVEVAHLSRIHTFFKIVQTDSAEYPCCIEQMPDIKINEYEGFINQNLEFLKPLEKYEEFFTHFFLQKNYLFMTSLGYFCRREKKEDEPLSIESFGAAVAYTYEWLENIIQERSTFADIKPILELLDPRVLNVDLIKSQFRKFPRYASITRDLKFMNMFELLQYRAHLPAIGQVCESYGLEGCKNSLQFRKIIQFSEKLQDDYFVNQLTIYDASNYLNELRDYLSGASPRRLRIFDIMISAKEFYNFFMDPENEYYKTERRKLFFDEIEIITGDLQDEDYNDKILSHLQIAYKFIIPFCFKESSFSELMKQIASEEFKDGEESGFEELETVNRNINHIRLWFIRSRGEAVHNDSQQLTDILLNGTFEINISDATLNRNMSSPPLSMIDPRGISTATPASDLISSSTILLTYGQCTRKRRQTTAAESLSPINSLEAQPTLLNQDMIDEFVRKLEFLEFDKNDSLREKTQKFRTLYSDILKLTKILTQLHYYGHPELMTCTEKYPLDKDISELKQIISQYESKFYTWKQGIDNRNSVYPLLSHFTMQRVTAIIRDLNLQEWDEAAQLLAFLFARSRGLHSKLANWLRENFNPSEGGVSSSEHLGKLLNKLHENSELTAYVATDQVLLLESIAPGRTVDQEKPCFHHIHKYHSVSDLQIMSLLISLYSDKPFRIPHNTEILHCTPTTGEEEIELFLKRTEQFPDFIYSLIKVNLLPTNLQEKIVSHMSKQKNISQTHYIETGPSVLGELSTVKIHNFGTEPNGNIEERCYDCLKYLQDEKICDVKLVYGLEGVGKTHYIKEMIRHTKDRDNTIDAVQVAIHEGFCLPKVIDKIKSKFNSNNLKSGNIIYFNFTIACPRSGKKDKKFEELMSSIGWFFFHLFILGYVYDAPSGKGFYMPVGLNWKIFVEVPIQATDLENPGSHSRDPIIFLDNFLDFAPILMFIGKSKLIEANRPYLIDEEVQLVCKYLRAFEEYMTRKPGTKFAQCGINTLYQEGSSAPIQFGRCPEVPDAECYTLLNKYMIAEVQSKKVLQKLFIKYMHRRCQILESLPAFNFNTGSSFTVEVEGEKKRICLKNLGSTLMELMLNEVNSTFCSLISSREWSSLEHHQLVYDSVGEGHPLLYLSLNPEKIPPVITQELDKIGVFVPQRKLLRDRDTLDPYLSGALGIRIPGKGKRLDLIDKEKYVLTSDFVMKMININERRMCGVPVIIEGETSVGKTELIRILSLLWDTPYEIEIKQWKSIFHETLLKNIVSEDDEKFVRECFHLVEKIGLPYTKFAGLDFDQQLIEKIELIIQRFFHSVIKCLQNLVEMPAFYLLDFKWDEKLHEKIIQNKCLIEDSASLSTFLINLLKAPPIKTSTKLNMQSIITEKEIKSNLNTIVQRAETIHNRCTNVTYQNTKARKKIPIMTLFFDEFNTGSCLSIIKEIMTDNSLEGTPLPNNLFVIAACHPQRTLSVPISTNQSKERDWVLGWYHVNQIHPTMELLKWNFGALNEVQENECIDNLMAITAVKFKSKTDNCRSFAQVPPNDLKILSTFIFRGQSQVREYARETLTSIFNEKAGENLDKETHDKHLEETNSRAKSSVSQRDIKRVFILIEFLGSIIETPPGLKGEEINHYNICRKIILVAVGIVYYLRLDHIFRRRFKTAINIDNLARFEDIFEYEVNSFINKADLPHGIAKTQSLKENLFATIVCTITKIPLIIVGPPGTSKTLSFNLTVSNLNKAKDSKCYFQQSNFPSLDAQYYQCSRKSTSKDIENVFKRALKRQEANDEAGIPVNCVVFLDNVELLREQDSLEVLHYFLDAPKVSFVAISNHILDAAKSNRAINVFRPYQQDTNDLYELARGCFLQNENSKIPFELESKLKQYCTAYSRLEYHLKEMERHDFFGMRDFIHFLNYLNRHSIFLTGIKEELVVRALERNFSGVDSKIFFNIVRHFVPDQEESQLRHLLRNTVDVLRSSLKDKSIRPLKKTGEKLMEVRFKLIIDTSEDDAIIRLLFRHNVLDSKSRHFVCTDFLEDDEMQKVNLVSAIQNAASQGLTVIISHGDDIFECFYDLFNQNYKEINDAKTGVRYYANIAIGSHTKPCRIHPDFQCIVHMHKSEILSAPASFLNRFEKFLITLEDIKKATVNGIPKSMNKLVMCAIEKIQQFLSNLAPKNFYSHIQDTVNSLLIELLPHPRLESEQDSAPHLSEVPRVPSYMTQQSESEALSNKGPHIYLDLLIDHLREKYHFQILHLALEERNTIAIDILDLALSQMPDAQKEYHLIRSDPTTIMRWAPHALELLYTVDDPDAAFIDSGRRLFDAKLIVNYGERLVASMILQFIIRYVCCQLLKVTIPETITINKNFIDPAYRKHYLYYQNHFSLKNLVASHIELLEEVNWDIRLRPTKLICFTTTNSFLNKLPDPFPIEQCGINEENSIYDIRSCIYEHPERVSLFSLRFFPTQEHFLQELKNFIDSNRTVMVLVVNVQLVSTRKINFVRHMIEQEERLSKNPRKFFVLILHYSPGIFHSQGFNSAPNENNQHSYTASRYPSDFVLGWDHCYIDSVSPPSNIVDIQAWLKLTIDNVERVEWKEAFVSKLRESLMEYIMFDIPSLISFRAKKVDSRTTINSKSHSVTRRIHFLKKIFECTDIGRILCEKFVHYWTPKAIQERLVIASSAVISRYSNLNISDYVQTNIRFLFSQYIIEMIFRINDDLNLDTLFEESHEDSMPYQVDNDEENVVSIPNINKQNCALFGKILLIYDYLPSIENLQLVNRSKDMSVNNFCWSREFPFSKYISQIMEDMIEGSLKDIAPKSLDTPGLRPGTGDKMAESDNSLQDRLKENLIHKLMKIETTGKHNGIQYPIISIILDVFIDQEAWTRYKTDYIISRLELQEDMSKFIAEFAHLWGMKFNCPGQSVIDRVVSFHVENYFNPPDSSRQLYLVLHLQKNTEEVDLIEPAHADFSVYILSTLQKLLSTCGKDIGKWKEWTLNYECLSSVKNLSHKRLPSSCRDLYLKLHFLYLINSCDRVTWTFIPNAIRMYSEYKNMGFEESSDLPTFIMHIQHAYRESTDKAAIHEFLSKFLDHYIDVYSPLGEQDCDYLLKFILNVFAPPSDGSQHPHEFYHTLSFQHLEHLLVQLLQSQPTDTNEMEPTILPFNTRMKRKIGCLILDRPHTLDDSLHSTIAPSFSSYFPPIKKLAPASNQPPLFLDAYIPPYYYNPKNEFIEQANKNVAKHMRTELAHLYFSVCMNEIERLMQERELEHMMRLHEQFSLFRESLELEVIAQIEKQALFQVTLKKYASFYDVSQPFLNPKGVEQYQKNFPTVIDAFQKELLNPDTGGGKNGGHSWVLLSWVYKCYSSNIDCTKHLDNILHEDLHGWLHDFDSKLKNSLNQSQSDFPWKTTSFNTISKALMIIQSQSKHPSTKISEKDSLSNLNDFHNLLQKERNNPSHQVVMTLWFAIYTELFCKSKFYPLDDVIARAFPELSPQQQKFICYFATPDPMNQKGLKLIRDLLTEPSCLQKAMFYFIDYLLSPSGSNSFYHILIFDPLSVIYLPGSLTQKKIGEDRSARIDLMCCLNEEGLYSADSFLLASTNKHNSFSLQSFYMINMFNSISLLLSYLIQDTLRHPEVQAKLFSPNYKADLVRNLISDVKMYWRLMVEVIGVYEEDMVSVIGHFFTKTPSGSSKGNPKVLLDPKDINSFELDAHLRFHKVSLTHVKHDLRKNPDLARNLWTLNARIPQPITAKSILAYIEPRNLVRPESKHLNNYEVVRAFISLRKPLRVGAMLLPIALRLYEIFHVDLNYVLVKDLARSKSLRQFVKDVSRQQSLYELKVMAEDFEIYLREYLNLRRPNIKIGKIPSPLYMYHLLNVDKKGQEPEEPSLNLLLTVIKDIIHLHNSLIDLASKSITKNAGNQSESSPSILPTQDSAISNMITDLTQSELVQFRNDSMASCRGDPPPPLTEEKLEASKFYRRRAPDSFIVVKEIQGGFNLEGIERDIIMTYISPKFKFDQLPEKEYHFRVQTPLAQTASQYYKINVFNDLLSEDFKRTLSEDLTRNLGYHFHMLDYTNLHILLKGLQTVTNFLIQSQNITPADKEWGEISLGMYAQDIMNQETVEKAFIPFDFNKLSKGQATIIAEIKIVNLFECFKFFHDKLNLKYYEFCHLTYSVKKPLPIEVEKHLEAVAQECLDNRVGYYADIEPFRIFLDDLQVKLQYKESYIIQNPKSSMDDILKLVHAYDIKHKRLISLLNQKITNEHYVHLILKIKSIVSQLKAKHPKLQKWEENVHNFWELHLPYFCEHTEDDTIDTSENILYHYNLDFFDTEISFFELLEQSKPTKRLRSALAMETHVYDFIPREAKEYL